MDRLTRDEILNEPAGPRMNEWVAELVMGWKRRRKGDLVDFGKGILHHGKFVLIEDDFVTPLGFAEQAPHYSADIVEAWPVLEVLRKRFWSTGIIQWDHTDTVVVWCESRSGHGEPTRRIYADADTVPLAICRAALLATPEV